MEIVVNITNRVRVKDDCNNWTRSDDLAFDANPNVLITSPVDESEHEYGEPVIFNAHIQGIPPVLAGLGDYIKWSVRKAGSTNWYGPYEPEPYNYWENHFDSELPFHPDDWTGATFEIIEFKDCEGLDVLARLDVCNIPEDMVTIYVEDGANSIDLGILVTEAHTTESPPCSGYWLIRDACDSSPAPEVLTRTNGVCEIDYAVQCIMLNECSFPEYIDTKVKRSSAVAPTTVRLFPVPKNSDRHNLLNCLFGEPSEGYVRYYSRSEDTKLNVTDKSPSNPSTDETTTPRLHINDSDCMYPGHFFQDFSVVVSIAADHSSVYYDDDFLNQVYYGEPDNLQRHGIFGVECDPSEGRAKCFIKDFLKGGVEFVEIEEVSTGKKATIGVQSRGDMLAVFSHAGFSTTFEEYALGPFLRDDELPSSINVSAFAAQCDFNVYCESINDGCFDIRWLVLSGCEVLSDESTKPETDPKPSWKQLQNLFINSGLVDSICGFKGLCAHGLAKAGHGFYGENRQFFAEFSNNLTHHGGEINSNLWQTQYAADEAVIAWMQTACEILRDEARTIPGIDLDIEEEAEIHPLMQVAAIDHNRRYTIKQTIITRWRYFRYTSEFQYHIDSNN